MIQQGPSTAPLYPALRVQAPSAPVLPTLPVLDAVIVRDSRADPFEPAPWYRLKATRVCVAVTSVAIAATAGITLWATAPSALPAPAPVVIAAPAPAPAPVPARPVVPPRAPAATPADPSSGDGGGLAAFAVIAGICCLLGRGGGGKAISGTFSGRVG